MPARGRRLAVVWRGATGVSSTLVTVDGGSDRPVLPREPGSDTHLRFEGFEVDLRSGELRKEGVLVHLRHQQFMLLSLLARHPGVLVTRDQIRDALWAGGTTVDFEAGLNRCVRELRTALGDGARHPRYIETLAKRGYRFIAPVRAVSGDDGRGQETSPARPRPRPATRLGARAVLAALLSPLLFAYTGPRGPSPRVLLAVLPFDDLGGQPDQSYFSAGLTEELSFQIGRVAPSRLGVIARGSTARYAGRARDVRAVSRELGVRYVVEGTVRRDRERVRVQVQLVDAADRSRVWTETHEGELRDILRVQDRLAQAIARRVGLTVAGSGRPGEAGAQAIDAEAYDLYLRGLQSFNRRTEQDLRDAADFFDRAADRQPQLALARAMLAQTRFLLVDRGLVPRSEGLDRIREEATSALEVDPTVPQAYVALAAHRVLLSWDWAGAEAFYREAIRHDANYATAHHWYANLLVNQRRCGEALAEIAYALELDPLSLIVNQAASSIHLICGRDAEAGAQAEKLLRLDPRWPGGHFSRARVLLKAGRSAEALAALDHFAASGGGGGPYLLAWQAHFHAMAGRRDVAGHVRDELLRLAATHAQSAAYEVAAAQTAAGDIDGAFRALDQAIRDQHPAMRYVGHDERMDRLRSDARFDDVMRRVGLLPERPSAAAQR